MIVINSGTRQFNIPGAEMTFGVEADAGSERKYFQCPRYVGNNLDLMGCFVRLNYRNANGEIDSYLVEDMTVDGENVLFSWELSPKVTAYKGQIRFVLCAVGPDTKVAWHTTLGTGVVLEGLEPEAAVIQNGTVDVVASLINMVNQQTGAVETEGANQIKAVQTAAKTAETAAVVEIEAKGVNVRASIPDDYTALSGAVRAIERGMAPGIVCEVEGTAVTVSDASNQAMQGLRIFGKSTQDGSPTPDAPVEIVSVEKPVVRVCGDNILNCTPTTYQHYGVKFTTNADGSVTVTGTATGSAFCRLASVNLTAGTQYVLTGGTSDITLSFRNHAMGAVYSPSDVEYVPDENVTVYVAIRVGAGVTVNETIYPMVRLGAVKDTTWKPYAGQTLSTTHTLPGIPVTSGGNYTDSDGQQWISDEVDLERGVYVQRVGVVVFDGSADEEWGATDGNVVQYYATILDKRNNRVQVDNVLRCSHFKVPITLDNSQGFVTETYWQSGNRNVLFNYDNGIGGLDNFKAWLQNNPVTLQYMLNTPIETPLSETEIAAYRAMRSNYPNTTVLNDAGAHMVVKYAADTKLYIDNKIKEAFA